MMDMNPTTITLGAVYGVLVFASTLIFILKRAYPDKDYKELTQRTNSWWVMISIFAVAVIVDRMTAVIFLAFVSFLALKEYFSLIPTRRTDRRVIFWAYLAVPLQYFWVYQYWYGMFIIFIPVWAFLFLPLRMLIIGNTEGFVRSAGTLHWGLMITVFNLSHAAYLLSLPLLDNPDTGSVGLLLFLVILTQFNDVAQYVWGKSLGGRKILPKVSPGKTWAGFLGGVATTSLAAYFLSPYLTPLTGWHQAGAGALIAVAGFIGDVTISAIKRDLGVKDTSSFIPGHGGILDRVDSLTFSAPVFFHAVFFFYYGPEWLT